MARTAIDMAAYVEDPLAAIELAQQRSWLADGGIAPLVIRYDEVRQTLGDPRNIASFDAILQVAGVAEGPFRAWMRRSPLNRDGDEHKQWRALLVGTFTPRSVERLRPRIAAAAHELIDGFAAHGRCDFMAEFADTFPSRSLCELIGVPVEDREQFTEWANLVGLGFNLSELVARQAEVDDATACLLDYASGLVSECRRDPRDNLVSRIAQAADDVGGIWDDDTIAASIAGLVFAGHETTKNQLGWMVVGLSSRPELWDGLAGGSIDPVPLVEELLRWRSAITMAGRTATEPIDHDGDRIEAGELFLVSLWAANHDPRVFPQPGRIDVAEHQIAPAAAFGHGPHHCIGANLARAELQEALVALTSRLTVPVIGEEATWRPPVGITGPITLPISFSCRSSATAP